MCTWAVGATATLDLRYLFEIDGEPAPPGGREPGCARWFSWPDAIAIADPGLSGLLKVLGGG